MYINFFKKNCPSSNNSPWCSSEWILSMNNIYACIYSHMHIYMWVAVRWLQHYNLFIDCLFNLIPPLKQWTMASLWRERNKKNNKDREFCLLDCDSWGWLHLIQYFFHIFDVCWWWWREKKWKPHYIISIQTFRN